MKTISRFIVYLLIIFATACIPDFSTPRYRSKVHKHWHRKQVIIFRQDVYRNPIVKKDTKRILVQPPKVNLDRW